MVLAPAQHRPIAGLALMVVAGMLLGQALPQGLWAYGPAAAGALVFWWLRGRRMGAALLAAALLAAAFRGADSAARERIWRKTLGEWETAHTPMTLSGTVETEPDGAVLPHGGARLSFRLKVFAAEAADGATVAPAPLPMAIDVDFYVPVSYLGESPSRAVPQAGEGWRFTGRIRSREVPYRTEPLLSLRATVDEPHGRASGMDAAAWRRRLWELRRETARRLALGIGERRHEVAILRAVLLGYRSDIPPDVRDFFAHSGTVHIFAISGLHIMLLAGLLRWALQWLGVPRRAQGLFLVPALAAYMVLTGGRPSAERACIMTSIFLAGPLFRRRPDAISSVGAAAIVILFQDPGQVKDLGFVFSFSSVLGILLLTPSLQRLLGAWILRRRKTPEDEAAELVERMEAARPAEEDTPFRRRAAAWVRRQGGRVVRWLLRGVSNSILKIMKKMV